jgi:hypothetical protein
VVVVVLLGLQEVVLAEQVVELMEVGLTMELLIQAAGEVVD